MGWALLGEPAQAPAACDRGLDVPRPSPARASGARAAQSTSPPIAEDGMGQAAAVALGTAATPTRHLAS